MNYDNVSFYTNRELSWLAFNERVLHQAREDEVPFSERLRFLSIFSSNLDEFYMVRVASLRRQIQANMNPVDNKTQLSNEAQLKAVGKKVDSLLSEAGEIYQRLTDSMVGHGLSILRIDQLTDPIREYFKGLYDELIFPTLTPMTVDVHRPFPTIQNLSLNVAFHLYKDEDYSLGIISLPNSLPRYFTHERDGMVYLVLIEDIIKSFSNDLFNGYEVHSKSVFRVTRDADFYLDEDELEDVDAFIQSLQMELKQRYNSDAVRLELDINTDDYLKKLLISNLDVDEHHLFVSHHPLDLRFLFQVYEEDCLQKTDLIYDLLVPQMPMGQNDYENMFDRILEHDILLHHPYESFEPVVRLIEQSADDKDVLAIKQTVYRASKNSPVLKALKRARENGKDVTVLFEVKARFDEENNLEWAKELENVGCQVIYGVAKYKTHSKILLIVRRNGNKIERVVHYGTGNYNEKTARLYTDFGFLTSQKEYVEDASSFFNYLTTYGEMPKYQKIKVSPFGIKNSFIKLIDKEIKFHKQYGNGYIFMKFNSLTDKDLIIKLLEASHAGVKIDLVIRGICCVVPNKNLTIISIVGRFLEHTRMYHFHQNGEDVVYISSADLMTRNMVRRIEIACPIENEEIKKRLIDFESIYIKDNVKATEKMIDGQYLPRKSQKPFDSQIHFYKMAYKEAMQSDIVIPKKKTIKKYIRQLFK